MAGNGQAGARGLRNSSGARRDPTMLVAPILLAGAVAMVGAGGGVEQLRSLSQVLAGPGATEVEALPDTADANSASAASWLAGNPLRGELAAISAERSASTGAGDAADGSPAAGGSSGDAAATANGGGSTTAALTPPPSEAGSGGGDDPGTGGGDTGGGVGEVVDDTAGRVTDAVGGVRDTVDRTKDAVSDKVDDVGGRADSTIDVGGRVKEGGQKVRDLPRDVPVP